MPTRGFSLELTCRNLRTMPNPVNIYKDRVINYLHNNQTAKKGADSVRRTFWNRPAHRFRRRPPLRPDSGPNLNRQPATLPTNPDTRTGGSRVTE